MGQWSTADLGDAKRQSKFMALLGGFKKGSALSDSSANKPKFNSALDKQRETKLLDELERQHEMARQTHFNSRGVGLGFAQTRANAIDTSSRSRKFSD